MILTQLNVITFVVLPWELLPIRKGEWRVGLVEDESGQEEKWERKLWLEYKIKFSKINKN